MLARGALLLSLLALFASTTAERAAAQGRRFRRTIVVNPVPSNPVRSGNRLLLALARASGATPTRPRLIRLEAGVYDVGSTTVSMFSFVDVEGSGQGVTTITGYAPGAAVLEGAADSEVRNLTVEHRGDAAGGWAIGNSGERFSIERVTALGSGGAWLGFRNDGDLATIFDLTVEVTGDGGVVNTGNGGTWRGLHVTVRGSGITYAMLNYADGDFRDVTFDAESSGAFAGGIRNEGAAASPVMRDVRAIAKGTIGQAITNGASSNARLHDVVAEAYATTEFAVGISNQFGSPALKNIEARAVGVTSAYGVANLYGSTVTMHEVNAVATGGTDGAGLLSDASTSFAYNSTFKGHSSVDLRYDPAAAATLGSCQLDGPVAGTGVLKCVSSYDGAFNPLTSGCTP